MYGYKNLMVSSGKLYSPREVSNWGIPTEKGVAWPTNGEYRIAKCTNDNYLNFLGVLDHTNNPDPCEHSPTEDIGNSRCRPYGCGFHASFNLKGALQATGLGTNVLTVVHGAGKVVEHETGFRSEKMAVAYILDLEIPNYSLSVFSDPNLPVITFDEAQKKLVGHQYRVAKFRDGPKDGQTMKLQEYQPVVHIPIVPDISLRPFEENYSIDPGFVYHVYYHTPSMELDNGVLVYTYAGRSDKPLDQGGWIWR